MSASSSSTTLASPLSDSSELLRHYHAVRGFTERICEPLEVEDYNLQSMPDVSPIKWHIAHTSWFFETFVLKPAVPNYEPLNSQYAILFNSYYNSVGEQHARPERGLLSRPTVADVLNYRAHVDREIHKLLDSREVPDEYLSVIETGIHHEQQHQELMMMDIKHAFSRNPLQPAYCDLTALPAADAQEVRWIPYEGQLEWMGHDGQGFSFDNESPRHRTYVESFQIADRLITNAEYLEFIEDGGYQRPELWLSEGWHVVQERKWQAPLYWSRFDDRWRIMTLGGMADLNPIQPVAHVSYYEADAYARWSGCWLPRENAWEAIASSHAGYENANFLEEENFQPLPPLARPDAGRPRQMFGDLWEWTCSPYSSFPGYRPVPGALGEYNGKFMCNQMVLRGGSFATPRSHIRATYRNFFPPDARWPFTGIRLTKELVS